MKTEINELPIMSIEDFADQHGLTMIVNERPRSYHSNMRFYARFEDSHVRESGSILCGMHGNGATPEAAIKDYARNIEFRELVLNSGDKEKSKEIYAPRFTNHLHEYGPKSFIVEGSKVVIDKGLLEEVLGNLYDLSAEISWYQHETRPGYADEFNRLEQRIEEVKKILDGEE